MSKATEPAGAVTELRHCIELTICEDVVIYDGSPPLPEDHPDMQHRNDVLNLLLPNDATGKRDAAVKRGSNIEFLHQRVDQGRSRELRRS